MGNTPRVLNPAVQSGIVTGFPGAQLFASPLRYDEDWTPQPYLAKSWNEYNQYQDMFALKLQQEHTLKFSGKFAAFRTILEVVHHQTV